MSLHKSIFGSRLQFQTYCCCYIQSSIHINSHFPFSILKLFIYANYLVLLYLSLWRSIIYIWVHYPCCVFSWCLREHLREEIQELNNNKKRRYSSDMNGVKYTQASNYCCLRTRLYAHILEWTNISYNR